MATVDEIKKKYEKIGWKFVFVHSAATQHLRKAPVIATKGSRKVKGTSLSNIFKKL